MATSVLRACSCGARSSRSLLVGVVVVGAGLFGKAIPAGFVPDEDQGIIGVAVQLPPGASLVRTSALLKQVEDILAKTEGVDSYQTIGGYGAVTSTYQPNFGTIFVRLHPWEERKAPELRAQAIMAKLQRAFSAIPEGIIIPFNIPTISGFGSSSGFNFLIQDRSGTLSGRSARRADAAFITAARQRPELANLFTSFNPSYPQLGVELDREKARKLGVPVNEAFQALSASLGGSLRQRLQPLRTSVSRVRAGGSEPVGRSPRTSARSTFAARPRTP